MSGLLFAWGTFLAVILFMMWCEGITLKDLLAEAEEAEEDGDPCEDDEYWDHDGLDSGVALELRHGSGMTEIHMQDIDGMYSVLYCGVDGCWLEYPESGAGRLPFDADDLDEAIEDEAIFDGLVLAGIC